MLAWLLGEPAGRAVRGLLGEAEAVVASDLTVLESHRALTRGAVEAAFSEARAAALRAYLDRAAAHWILLGVADAILQRARRPFPLEPVRTLDAIHLASALLALESVPDLRLLSLDTRVRRNAKALGMAIEPPSV